MKPALKWPQQSWTWQDWDKLWEKRYREFERFEAEGFFVSPTRKHLNKAVPAHARRLLEVGSGSGRLAVQLALDHPGSLVTGVDKSPWAIRLAERIALQMNCTNVNFIHSDMRKLPFISKSFDFVVSEGLIEHFNDYQELVQEHVRMCDVLGCVVEIVPNAYCLPHRLLMLWQGDRYYYGKMRLMTRGEMSKLLASFGLIPTHTFGIDPLYLSGARWYSISPILRATDRLVRRPLDMISRGAFSRALGFEIGVAAIRPLS